ncbi:MAG: DUF308 domain-containing protein [Lactobacillus sp.]|nr:DUF308 domain-containing protein [Lactobacillus sp.]
MFNRDNFQRGFDWGEFLSGVLFIVLAIYFFRKPAVALGSLVVFAALIAIMRGIVSLSSYTKFKSIMPASWSLVFSGILDIVIGLIFLFNAGLGGLTISYLFAIWFIIDAAVGLVTSAHLRHFGNIWFILAIVFDVLALIVGVLMLLRPMYAAFTMIFLISWFFMIIGINNVIVAIARRS